MGLAANETGPAMWDLARAYADVQSSKSAQLIGATPSNPALSRRALAAQFDRIKYHTQTILHVFCKNCLEHTIRQQCATCQLGKIGLSGRYQVCSF